MTKEEMERRRAMCPGMGGFEWQRLIEWMKAPNRKPAIIAFTAGHCRDAARAFEAAVVPDPAAGERNEGEG